MKTEHLLKQADNFVRNCEFDRAIDAFLAVQAWDDAGGLLELYAQDFYQMGRAKVVLGWLETIDKNELGNRPRLLLLQGQILTDDCSRHEQALEVFSEAESVFQKLGNNVGEFKAQVWQSVAYRLMGQGGRSLEIIEAAMEALPERADEWTRVWAARYHALSCGIVGGMIRALDKLDQCLEKFTKLDDPYHIGMCYYDMAVCLESLARISEAEYHYETAAYIFQKLGNKNNLVKCVVSLAYLLCLAKRYDEALGKLGGCLEIAKEIESPYRLALILETMANIYRNRGDYELAVKTHIESIQFTKQAGALQLQTRNMIHLAESYLYLDDWDLSLTWTNQAVQVAIDNGLMTEYGQALCLRSRIYMRLGRDFAGLYKKAIVHVGCDVAGQNREKLYLAHGLLFYDSRPLDAYDLLLEVLDFSTKKDVLVLLSKAVLETQSLFEYFFFHRETNPLVVARIRFLLESCLVGQTRKDSRFPNLQVFGLGELRVLVPNDVGLSECRDFHLRGEIVRRLPEFLMLLIVEGRGLSVEQISESLWPHLKVRRAKAHIKQILQVLKKSGFCVEKEGRNKYRLVKNFWCDVLALLKLSDLLRVLPSAEAQPLCRELQHLYGGDFLAGFELSEWGESFRASLREKMLIIA